VEIESLAEFDRLVAAGASEMDGWRFQAVDLRSRADVLRRLQPAGSLFLGCRLDEAVEDGLRRGGALVFPVVPDVPVDPYRATLYTPEELYDGLSDRGYDHTLDAVVYAWSRQSLQPSRDLGVTLAEALHDHAIDDALTEYVHRRRLVGVMGGHALGRDTPGYAEAARLGRDLARSGLLVATGGGPGAMEAANLGAYLSDHDDEALDQALRLLSDVPSFTPSIADWAAAVFEVRRRWPHGAESLGIPTWYYGHEPPNAFASRIAKYFKNAIREDILLHVCTAGIVFLPGAGGTVQEIFQDACENYYADEATVAPMVLVGEEYWTDVVPVWPLLTTLARGRPMAEIVHLVDRVEDVTRLVATAAS